MEDEKKLDFNSILGFALIGVILMWVMYQNQPTPEEIEAQKAKQQEQVDTVKQQEPVTSHQQEVKTDLTDSVALEQYKGSLGAFAYSATLPSASDKTVEIENNLIKFKISNKGGEIVEAKMKNFVTFDSLPVYLIKDGNASFDISFGTSDNRTLNTRDLYFQPSISKNGDNQILSMKLKVSENQFLEYRYELKPDDYMVGFTVRSQGLGNILNQSQPAVLNWKLKSFRRAKSISYENRYTELVYEYEDGKDDYLGQRAHTEDEAVSVTYAAYKQHFFSSILLTDKAFKTAKFVSENLVEDEEKDTLFTKSFAVTAPLEINSGDINYTMDWYHGPSDFKILNSYDRNLDEVIPLGWGIFGWINRYVLIPLFGFLSSFLPYGFAIIAMTVLVRIALSPVTYKSYLSQAKMKIIRPEVNEINAKYKDNAMKKQQETMKLYSKAGVSPMAGCIPALLQLPVFYALFMFFPSAFVLRQKSFLWAEDLSSYDVIAKLPFHIPFYGNHVSLFPILASVAIFFYMRMTTGQQMAAQQPAQEGMPDMSKMMKYMMYISPLMMLFFFNNYASGLSLYYFVSNLITIGIMLVIKNYILDEDKIHAQIQENKKKPKKENKFQRKMREMMEQAEAQKKAGKR